MGVCGRKRSPNGTVMSSEPLPVKKAISQLVNKNRERVSSNVIEGGEYIQVFYFSSLFDLHFSYFCQCAEKGKHVNVKKVKASKKVKLDNKKCKYRRKRPSISLVTMSVVHKRPTERKDVVVFCVRSFLFALIRYRKGNPNLPIQSAQDGCLTSLSQLMPNNRTEWQLG